MPLPQFCSYITRVPLQHSRAFSRIFTASAETFVPVTSCWKLHNRADCIVNIKECMNNEVCDFEWVLEDAFT
jgi:hypothetical protein